MSQPIRRTFPISVLVFCAAWLVQPSLADGDDGPPTGRLEFDVSTPDGDPLPCRIHLSDAEGNPHRAPGLPFWRDHSVCSGRVGLDLEPGTYRYEIERGPEHERLGGTVEVQAGREHPVSKALPRIADLAAQGWYAGDLHVHRPPEDVPLLMQAEDLHIAQVITWWNKRNPWKDRSLPDNALRRAGPNRFYHLLAGEDERGGGALLYFHLSEPLDIAAADREAPSSLAFLDQARRTHPQAWIDIEKPFWWDVPAWVVSGQVDSIGIANNHMCRSQMLANEAWGRPRDTQRLPDPLGNGYWTQEIYYHLLNSGIRLPPSAGSASGVLPNPVGYNRVYVHAGQPLDYEAWWRNLEAGQSFVTNGPLLVCRANGELPGHVFSSSAGRPIDVELSLTLTSVDRVPRIEIIRNGRVVKTLDVGDAREQTLTAQFPCSESGWFLVRAIADHPRTFRFASTAPWYVEIGEPGRYVSRESVRFFLDWLAERRQQVAAAVNDPDRRRDVLSYLDRARDTWHMKLASARGE